MYILKFRPLAFALFLSWLLAGCGAKNLNVPQVTNTTPPGKVTNIILTNLNGKATLTYTLPSNPDMSYVKAVYDIGGGATNETVVSRYTNTMTLEGFGDTLSHTVKLYAVNASDVASDPVIVTVHPLTPGYILARRALQVAATFGGFSVNTTNKVMDNLAIIPLVDTAGNGQWVQTVGMDNVYSNDSLISAVIRNQPAIKRKYAFTVRDRWMHYSDTMVVTLTPWFEALLDKSKWSTLVLPHDATVLNNGGYTWPYFMYDGNFHPGWPQVYFTVESAAVPQMVTLDLGAAHNFSRFQVNPYLEVGNLYYVRGNLKDFEIWASNNPDQSDPVDAVNTPGPSWTKLGTYHVTKPSGSAYQTETAADQTAAYNGWQFNFPVSNASYRYIRIRQLSNWQGSYFISMAEFTLWGN